MERLNSALAEAAQRKGVGYRCRISSEVPRGLRGDFGRLNQALTIIFGSAVSFTQAGQVSIEVSLIDLSEMETTLRFTVSDTGQGLTHERLSSVYEALSPEEYRRPRSQEAAGLGLAMAGRIAERLGGHIFVQSREGEGTAFHLTVALKLQETEAGLNFR